MWSDLDYDEERQFLYRDEYQHERDERDTRGRSLVKGLVAGIAGGLAAAAAMNLFQKAISATVTSDSHGAQSQQPADDREDEDATMKTAEAVSELTTGQTLTKEQRETGGTLVHYAFGAAMGAVYGVLTELAPRTASGFGTPYGAAVWLGADEIAMPALGLSKGPTELPASTHLQAFAAHLVYGLTADTVRRLIRRAI